MSGLRKKLTEKLIKQPGIDIRYWKPDHHLLVIYHNDREIAHFHGNNELDIRLSREFVKREGLTHAPNRIGHPERKNGGRWLIVRFTRQSHLTEIERLIKVATELA